MFMLLCGIGILVLFDELFGMGVCMELIVWVVCYLYLKVINKWFFVGFVDCGFLFGGDIYCFG